MITVEEEEPPLPVDIVDEEFIDETKLIEQTEPPRKKKNPALKKRPILVRSTEQSVKGHKKNNTTDVKKLFENFWSGENTDPPANHRNRIRKLSTTTSTTSTTTSTTTTTSTSMLKAAHIDNVGRNRSPRTTTKANHVRKAKTTTAKAHMYTTSKSPKLVRKTTTSKPKAEPKWRDHWQRFANMFYGFGGYRH